MFFAKTKRKKPKKFSLWPQWLRPGFTIKDEAKQGICLLLLTAGAILLGAAFWGQAGQWGARIDTALAVLLGGAKWILPAALLAGALSLAKDEDKDFNSANLIGLFLFFTCLSSLLYFFNPPAGGGILGLSAAELLLPYVGPLVAAAVFTTGIIISLLLFLETGLSSLVGRDSLIFKILAIILGIIFSPFMAKEGRKDPMGHKGEEEADDNSEADDETVGEENGNNLNDKAVVKEYEVDEVEEGREKEEKAEAPAWPRSRIQMNIPLNLLESKPKRPASGNIGRNQNLIKRTLLDFGIPVTMGEVLVGPTVTQYTFKPAKGIPVSRVKALAEDLALELALHPVRIEAPIPGKPLVGLEVPNRSKAAVSLKEIMQSRQFKDRKSNTVIPLGRDVTGRICLGDLAKLPHLLIAGATNSGKSVFLHSLITSLLYQNNPDDLKLILIDVKQVELTSYNNLPYLLAPVITEGPKAIRGLQWCLGEMERRLETLGQAGCRNIREYNKRRTRMPYLVVVVDELGDIMSLAKKEAEAAIIRLGQKARAAGIHLVLAMQRPSVDILSGLIKANMPGRVSFQVTSSVNSKTILDFTGAEKLIGQGDLLFIDSGLSRPVRVQGPYIGKKEVTAVSRYIRKKAGQAEYVPGLAEARSGQTPWDGASEEVDDELIERAKEIIFQYKKASATMLQSRLSIGYPRANRLLDVLEKQGIVGPSIQNKPREVYLDN